MNSFDASFWNQRFGGDGYLYGTEPNAFLEEHHALLRGPVLSLSEGEGRNAVFLTARGLDVTGVDYSAVALDKATRLAASRGVAIRTQLADLASYEPMAGHYGAVISIFAHLPSGIRRRLYPLIAQALEPGGILLLEAYSERQLTRDTGGPRDPDLLMTVDKLRLEFPDLQPLLLQETLRDVSEGAGHSGMASVVQFIGRRPAWPASQRR